jgi:CHAT domain-containing protein
VLVCLAFFAGCSGRKALTPDDIEAEIVTRIQRAQFDAALQEADAAANSYKGRNLELHWRFRVLGARAQIFRGQYKDAIDRLRPSFPPELANTVIAILRVMTIASAEEFSEQFAAAENDIAEAERLAASATPKIRMQVLQIHANVENSQNKFAEAEAIDLEELEIARRLNLPVTQAEALGNLGNAEMGLEHYDEAADRFKASLELAREVGNRSSVATTLGNIGLTYAALGDYESARENFQQAADAAATAGQAADRILWLSNVASAYNKTREYVEAEKLANQGLKLAYELGDPLTTVICLNALTVITLETNRLELAEKYNGEARAKEVNGFLHGEIVVSQLNAARIAEAKGRLQEAGVGYTAVRTDPLAGSAARWEAEARLAGVYQEENRPVDAEKEFRLCLKTVDEARSGVSQEELRLSFLSGAMPFYGQYIDFLVDEKRFEDALAIAETGRARTLAEGLGHTNKKSANAVGGAALRGLAKQLNSTLLCYRLGPRRSHLWVISAEGIAYFPLAGSAEIGARVKNYREAIVNSRDLLHPANADGAQLYGLLVQPAQAIIAKNPRVTILPDASLYGLNFETLLVPGAQPHYWIEDVSVTTASSLTLLAASLSRPATTAKSLLVVGNTEEVSGEFPKLAQASAEMEVVEKYFPATAREVLEGKDATPSAYLMGHPEQFGYLHFVTHGTASLTRPLESAVILSPAGETYKLYARDIVEHPLHANLVTISACNGAGMRAFSGEGLVGLSWAFLRAGAHNVIAALWEVNDRSTPQLMNALYGGLSKGQEPATALRGAKLSLLRSGTVYAKPFYWAPFQLYAGS